MGAQGDALRAMSRLRFPQNRDLPRRYPELVHPYRNDFQRDRDRVIHSHAFRRLENKTQVFAAGRTDHTRNRLTHTLEVSQIARSVASAISLDEDFTEALALAHDIGHPPFAHSGEQELNRQMQAFQDRFDHNLHALRIVERFEHRYARFPGINLTFVVREGMVKHSRDFERGEIPELDEFLPGLRPPLEAQLIDLADEVAYNSADIDDAHSAGMLPLEDVAAAVPLFGELFEQAEMQYPGAPDHIRAFEMIRGLINVLASGLIEGTIEAAAALQHPDEVRQHPERIARFSPATAEASLQIKQLLRERVYHSPVVLEDRQRATDRIAALFQCFVKNPELLPQNYRDECDRQPVHRTVCDYIAGMTDGYFVKTYNQLLG